VLLQEREVLQQRCCKLQWMHCRSHWQGDLCTKTISISTSAIGAVHAVSEYNTEHDLFIMILAYFFFLLTALRVSCYPYELAHPPLSQTSASSIASSSTELGVSLPYNPRSKPPIRLPRMFALPFPTTPTSKHAV